MTVDIARGTTPEIVFAFQTVDPSTITSAKLTIQQKKTVTLTKELSDATVSGNTISFRLSQAETLAIGGFADIWLNWLTSDGVRGVAKKLETNFVYNPLNEVMT